MRPILYVCGPYKGTDSTETTKNVMTARSYAIEAWRRGWTVFCPHLNSAHFERCIPEIRHAYWYRIKPGVAHDILIQFTTPFPGVKVVNHDAENDDARRDLPGR